MDRDDEWRASETNVGIKMVKALVIYLAGTDRNSDYSIYKKWCGQVGCVVCFPPLARLTDSPPSVPDWLAQSGVRSVRACDEGSVAQLYPAGRWFDVHVVRGATIWLFIF
ncbi:hypothetical protein E2C01_062131 [Portunus trituberculatus]|uniref:Uncharacterized protein n=1 Tax=Portunus trituberculatus TaxID=210409 RepID=A0A5B7HH65_PORTR|nr:hypothetical protein [Portunus trituberculatus]